MARPMDELKKALVDPFARPVYYLASTEHALLREAAQAVLVALEAAGDVDITRIDGPVPDMGDVIASAGAISFFGTPRVVEIREVSPTTMGDKDIDELCTVFGELENAVLVVTALYKDKKAATGKKAKKLMEAAGKIGFAAELAKPTRADNLRYIEEQAAALGATFERGAAEMLLERAGDDRLLLKSEVQKLCAACGYKTVSQRAVAVLGTQNIEADVFELARLITSGREGEAQKKLQDLLNLRHEPIAISAALSGTYVDMLRVRSAKPARKNVADVMRDMGYKGSDWRLKKAGESAARYTPAALDACILCLERLDLALKSSALPDKGILLQAAVSELVQLGKKR